jgi:AcrR family transcriptional regulator
MVRARRDRPGRARTPVGDDATDARGRILDAAEELIARDGFDATPTARIAERADVPKGLLFYYFPKKIDVLRTLLAERLPLDPLCRIGGIARPGDLAGSLLRLARELDLGRHHSLVLSTILFREASTHPEVGDYLRALRDGLIELTERVLDAASPNALDKRRRSAAADTYVAVLLYEANARRFNGPLPDLAAAARIVAGGLASS